MSKFIEVTTQNKKITINVDFIFKITPSENGCMICFTVKGGGENPFQTVHALESYEDIKSLISR